MVGGGGVASCAPCVAEGGVAVSSDRGSDAVGQLGDVAVAVVVVEPVGPVVGAA